MGAVCDELDNSNLFFDGNVLITSLMWDRIRIRLWELFGSQNGLTENEGHLNRSTSWALRTMRGGNWTGIDHGRLEHDSLGIDWNWLVPECMLGWLTVRLAPWSMLLAGRR